MKYGDIFVEGQTEVNFVKNILNPYLATSDLSLTPILQGGTVKYSQWNKDIKRSLHRRDVHLVTTMLDFYRLPRDFPRPAVKTGASLNQHVEAVEKAWAKDINARKFLPYIACQEFEAMLFANLDEIADAFPDNRIASKLRKIRQGFINPEEINDKTPPSKHILGLLRGEYQKPLHGYTITHKIGLEHIRQECPHFNQWIEKLQQLGNS